VRAAAHAAVVCLDPGHGVEFLCRCGAVLDDMAAGLQHLLNPEAPVPAVGPMTETTWRQDPWGGRNKRG
jgi:hypothetical protein